jgi:hypothetical protein
MQQPKILSIAAVGGVSFNMLKDGSTRAYVNPQNAERFKTELLRVCNEIDKYLISEIEMAKAHEQERFVMPKSRVQELEEELARLRASEVVVPVGQVYSRQQADRSYASAMVPPPAIPFNEDQARAHTIVRGGFEPDSDDGLIRPTGPQL